MRCKLVHLDASLVHWFRNVRRRRRHKTETKGGQKGINPGRRREGVAKFLSVILELKVSLGLFRYLAAIKTTRLIMKRVMGLEFICLLNLFMSLFDCTETIGPTHPHPRAQSRRESLKCKRKRAPFLETWSCSELSCSGLGLALSAAKSGRKSAIKQATKPAAATSNLFA